MAFSANDFNYSVFGNFSATMADLAVSEAYAEGGISLPYETLFGLHDIYHVLIEPKNGFNFEYDYTNKKIKAFNPNVPLIRYDEFQTCPAGSYVVTLDYPAAFIMNVAKPGQNLVMRSTAVTPGSNQCSLPSQMSKGVRTQITLSTTTVLSGGDFTGGSTGWTIDAAAWTAATDALDKDANGVGTIAEDAFAAEIGVTYELTYTISNWTVGTVTPTVGGTAGTAVGADGTYTERIVATTTGGILFTPTNTSRFTIDDISLTPLSVRVTYVTQAWKEVWDNLVQDEAVTLATGNNTLTSGNKIAACMYVDQTTATAAALTMIDEDDTTASGEIRVMFNVTTAQLNCHSAQNAKAVKMTYIKVPTSGFLKDRLFNDETSTQTGADPYILTFAKNILLWGYAGCMPVNGGTTQVLIELTATPAAGEAVLDLLNPDKGFRPVTSGAGASHNHVLTGTAQSPVIKVEEAVTVTTNVGTLSHVPLYIVSVHATAGSTTGAFSVIPTGETPLTKQVAVNFTTGVMTFLGTDAVTAAKVTYIPKRGSGYLSSVTVDEVAVASASKVNLAARAGLVQYVWDNTDNVLANLEQPGTAPSATHYFTVDINDSANTSIDCHADDATNSLKVTYVPYTQIPPGCFIDDTDITLSSEVWNFTGDPGVLGYNNLVVPGFGVNLIGETGAAARAAAIWEGPSGTGADGVATWNPATNSILTNQDTAMTIASIPWMILDPLQLTPTTPAGTNAAEATHTHAIAEVAPAGTIAKVKSNVTGTGAGIWGSLDEVSDRQPLELLNGTTLTLTSLRVMLIGH